MPEINGLEVLMKIKSDERTKSIPVVMQTTSNEIRILRPVFGLTLIVYIVKPVEFNNFIKAVGKS